MRALTRVPFQAGRVRRLALKVHATSVREPPPRPSARDTGAMSLLPLAPLLRPVEDVYDMVKDKKVILIGEVRDAAVQKLALLC